MFEQLMRSVSLDNTAVPDDQYTIGRPEPRTTAIIVPNDQQRPTVTDLAPVRYYSYPR